MPATDPFLIERLRNARSLRGVPLEELEWMAARSVLNRFSAGSWVDPSRFPLMGLTVILSGTLSIHVEHGGVRRRVMEWLAGDLIGALPYSRMTETPGKVWVNEDAELFTVVREHYPELIRACPETTAICVHTLLDRARVFTGAARQDEKMMSLGRLASGLAKELDSPASSALRSAEQMLPQLVVAEETARTLFGAGLDTGHERVLDEAAAGGLAEDASPERARAVAAWLDARGVAATDAGTVARAMSVEDLDRLEAAVPSAALATSVRWLAACRAVHTAAAEIQVSTKSISELVAAVKGFTHMGRATGPEPVNLARGLSDTARIVAAKALEKGATITLDVMAGLPHARAFGSELNQIWVNLLENAIDAVPPGGQITVRAASEGDRILVDVTDDGHGIPDEISERIFDPFFTTRAAWGRPGMGLELVRRLVIQYGGEIGVESRPGHTRFRVAIPVASGVAERSASR